MSFSFLHKVIVPTILISSLPLGCGTESGNETQYISASDGGAGSAGAAGAGLPQDGGEAGAATDSGDSSTLDVSPGDGSTPGETILYAHDRDTLYTVDPEDPQLSVKKIGKFDCIGSDGEPSMTDIAVDRDGRLFGVSSKALFLDMQIDGNTVRCKAGKVPILEGTLGSGARFYGLTFAPPTPELGAEETLIGANTLGEMYRIDRTTGALTPVGKFGTVPSTDGRGHSYPLDHVGTDWALSGDVVFLTNQGDPIGFATLRDCEDPAKAPSGCSRVDTLVEIDVNKLKPITSGAIPIVTKSIRGQILPNGCSEESCGFGSIYGIAAFNDRVYGFSYQRSEGGQPATGALISIDNDTGAAQLISTPLSGDGFAGAGVTTLAPVLPPPPK